MSAPPPEPSWNQTPILAPTRFPGPRPPAGAPLPPTGRHRLRVAAPSVKVHLSGITPNAPRSLRARITLPNGAHNPLGVMGPFFKETHGNITF